MSDTTTPASAPTQPPAPQPPAAPTDFLGSILGGLLQAIQLFPAKNESTTNRNQRYVALAAIGLSLLQNLGVLSVFRPAAPSPQPAPASATSTHGLPPPSATPAR